ncbi:unnamed protein product [Rotaria sp. Silwood1]|nr:unnamed protein product [Rotaria sp. Silwood1]CAF3435521.1 unnamed protein product [Rotaria sp. Silwood1]CAF3460501.1 unnamed protein product [Rotaria sp. Silwood1]CAF4573834.1 unnamed protein product [Rotaria sp. Silwood1]CAF4749888.1 unnamed protein product [Rotaria sp. Silwood1]
MNNKSNSNGIDMPNKLNIEECSINELKSQIAQIFSLSDNSFDIYCQGVQLTGDDKNLNDYEIENEDNLLIVPKVQLPNESFMINSAGLPSKTELHQSSKTIEKSATPNEFHRLYWLMKTSDFWRRITQVLPELLLDSSALGLCEDSVLFCQNYNVKRLTEIVETNPLLYKAIIQVIKEWTSTNNLTSSNDVQLSPAAYFLNGSPHLIEPVAPRQPTFNVMPRRITNEDFYRALEQTNRSTTNSTTTNNSRSSNISLQQTPRTSNRRNIISMDQLRSVLQRTSTTSETNPSTTMETSISEPTNVQTLLDQMYAMGLTDQAANRQALEATNWDLKAALDLLLG